MNPWTRTVLALCLAVLPAALPLAAEKSDDIAVRVEILGDVVQVDAEVRIAASKQEVWDVLTDFERLPQFISNIVSSKVLSRSAGVVRVAQTGKTSFGPLTFEFQSERELTLAPFEQFESRMLSGNMKRYRGVTRLEAVDGGTRIRFHSEAVPDTAMPLGLGRALIESETREHFHEVRREVLRRKNPVAGK